MPLFLLLSLYGAKELGISIEVYFSKPEFVFEGQMKMTNKYKNDCLVAFYYGSLEIEAVGGDTIFIENGPPNSGKPIIQQPEDILKLQAPKIDNSGQLQKVLQTTKLLKKEVGNKIPIVGVVISPFFLAVMQMGFDKYLDLLYGNNELFNTLMNVNREFCINWSNAQLGPGVTAICYFDPVSSPTIIPAAMYRKTGIQIAKHAIPKINGPTATHFASSRTIPIIDDVEQTGTAIICPSSLEDIGDVKNKAKKRTAVLENLNGIKMCRWTEKEAKQAGKNIIDEAGKGCGLVISDNHVEIPYQVHEKTLIAISIAVQKHGTYPLK